jgi:hypothetical protein
MLLGNGFEHVYGMHAHAVPHIINYQRSIKNPGLFVRPGFNINSIELSPLGSLFYIVYIVSNFSLFVIVAAFTLT